MTKQIVLSLVAAMGLALPAFAQDSGKPATKPAAPAQKQPEAKPAPHPNKEASMDAGGTEGALSDNHKLLGSLVGTWSAKCKFWLGGPEAPPTESTGSTTNTLVLGGRFVRMEFKGEFMGSPFEGLGYFGFDNVEQKFVNSWMDTVSTGIATTSGKYDPAKKTFTMTGEFKDVATHEKVNSRDVHTVVDGNTLKFEMYRSGADGKEQKTGEITYTRTGAAPTTPVKPKILPDPSR